MASKSGIHSSHQFPHPHAESFQAGGSATALAIGIYKRANPAGAPGAGVTAQSDPAFTAPVTGELTIKYNGPPRRVIVHNYGNTFRTTGGFSTAANLFYALGRKNGSAPANGDQLQFKQFATHTWVNMYLHYSYSTILDLVDDDYIAPLYLLLVTAYSYGLGNSTWMDVETLRFL